MLSRELIEKNVDIVLQMPSLFDKVEQCLITGDLVAASAILENTASFRVYFELSLNASSLKFLMMAKI